MIGWSAHWGTIVLDQLMPDLWIAWQPIYNLRSGTIWGHEALIRGPRDSLFPSPSDLFELARHEEVEEPFEEICRKMAFEAAARALRRPGMLFVNVNPRFLGLPIAPDQPAWPADHTVIEITEASPLFDDPEALQAQVATWRAAGYRIALDDFGAGFAGQAAVLALKPDVVKVDQRLVHDIDQDRWRQTIVAAMLHMCSDLGIATIAEGIETQAELDELVRLGVVMGQGFLLGRPSPEPERARLGVLRLPTSSEILGETARQTAATSGITGAGHYAADPNRRIVFWDAAAEAITGRTAAEMIGLPCWLSGMDHRDLAGNRLCFGACPLVRAMQQNVPQDSLLSLRDRNGERRWVTMHTEPVLSQDGNVTGAMESFAVVAQAAEESLAVGGEKRAGAHGRDASHHLFWRKEVARWLATWQSDEHFARMAERFVRALPFRSAAVWQTAPDAGKAVAIAAKGTVPGNSRGSAAAADESIVARAFAEKRVIYMPGTLRQEPQRAGVHLTAAIPLMHKGVVQGVLTLGDDEGDRLPVPAIEAIEEIAPLLGSLMANQELVASLQQSRQVFAWMLESAPLALDYQPYLAHDEQMPSVAAFRSFRRRWPEVAGVRGGILAMRSETESGAWMLHDVWGTLDARDLSLQERWWPKARAFLSAQGLELPPDGTLPDDHPLAVSGRTLYHYAMRDGRSEIASLLVDVPDERHVQDETLLAVLEFTGLATVNRWRQRQLLRLSRHDPLTGAWNRRALEERLETYFSSSPASPALFLLIDVDDLKRVNDRFGHQAADGLLKEFTAYVRAAVRPSDEVARIGGDEFVWVLYEAHRGAETRARLQRIIAESPLQRFGSNATVGVVELPREAQSYADAYRLADRRLYQGKHGGKGLIVDGDL